MRTTRQWGQLLLGVGLGLLIGGSSNLVKQNSAGATVLFLLAALCLGTGLFLMRR